jgi:hypothetical protein
MGPEIFVIFALGMMGPLALLGLVASWLLTASDRTRVEVLWERYARRRGLTFVPAAGQWPNRTAPGVRWLEGDARYTIEARGDEALVSTRVVARPSVAVFGSFVLRPAAPKDRSARVTGDPMIDARFDVASRPEALAARLLTPEVKRALVGFDVGSSGSLTYERGDVKLVWSGGEENDARLDEAREVVRRVVRALDFHRTEPPVREGRLGERVRAGDLPLARV